MRESGRIYANRACPHCEAPLEPLPSQRTACQECGRTIHVRTGPDGLTYLLRPVDLSTLEVAWADYEDARRAPEPEVRRAAAARYLETTLASYQAAGIAKVEISTDGAACPACATVAGRAFAIEQAPVLPVQDCQGESCRCDYVPILE